MIYVPVVPVCIWQLLDSRLGLTKIRIFFRKAGLVTRLTHDASVIACFGDMMFGSRMRFLISHVNILSNLDLIVCHKPMT